MLCTVKYDFKFTSLSDMTPVLYLNFWVKWEKQENSTDLNKET